MKYFISTTLLAVGLALGALEGLAHGQQSPTIRGQQSPSRIAPQPPRPSLAADKKKHVGRSYVIFDLDLVNAAVADVETALTDAMEASAVVQAQDRIKQLTEGDGPIDVRLLLQAVGDLQDSYETFLGHQSGILERVDSGQEEIAHQLANVDVKVAHMLSTGAASQAARIDRSTSQLRECAVRIKRAEDNGSDTTELRRAFEQQKAVHDILVQIQSVGSADVAAGTVAARIRTVLEARQQDLELLEVQLEISKPIINSELALLDIVGMALQAELDLAILDGEGTFETSGLVEFVRTIGLARGNLAGALGRALPNAAPQKAMSGPELNLSIDQYAAEGGYIPTPRAATGKLVVSAPPHNPSTSNQ